MGRSKTIPLETKLKLIQEYQSGDSSSVLAERYSVHQTTVLRIIRDKARFELWAKKLQEQDQARERVIDEVDDEEDDEGEQINDGDELVNDDDNNNDITATNEDGGRGQAHANQFHYQQQQKQKQIKRRRSKSSSTIMLASNNTLATAAIINHHNQLDSNNMRPSKLQHQNHQMTSMTNQRSCNPNQHQNNDHQTDITMMMTMMAKNSSSNPSISTSIAKLSEPYHRHRAPLRSRYPQYSTRNLEDIMDDDDLEDFDIALSPKNNGEEDNDENVEQNRRMMAFRKFFEYIDKIEEIVLAYDPEFNEAFRFTRDLNHASLRYRYLLYELEKRNNDRRQQDRGCSRYHFQFDQMINGHDVDQQNSTEQFMMDQYSNKNSDSIAMEFCNLIRAGISRAT